MGGERGKGSISVWVQISPDPEKIAEAYHEATGKMLDWRPAFVRMLPDVGHGVQHILSSQGAELQGVFSGKMADLPLPWKPLTTKYEQRKEKRYGSSGFFLATGAFLSRFGMLRMGNTTMRYGVSAPQARALQFGSAYRKAGRPYLGGSKEIIAAAWTAFDDYTRQIVGEMVAKANSARAAA